MARTFNNFFAKLFNRPDRLSIIEALGGVCRISEIEASWGAKKIAIVRSKSKAVDLHDRAALIAALTELRREMSISPRLPTLFALDPSLATTVRSSVIVVRDEPIVAITDADLDNVISQAIWKLYDRQRTRATTKMGVSDLDVVLTDVRVLSIKLDGSRVLNPLGFTARAVEIELSETFTPRWLPPAIQEVFPGARAEFFREAGVTHTDMLRKTTEAPNFLTAHIFSGRTDIFWFEGTTVSFVDYFEWGERNLQAVLAGTFLIDEEIAQIILARYVNERLSERLARRIDRLLLPELSLLARGLDGYLERVSSRLVYFIPFFKMPELTARPSFLAQFEVRPKVRFAETKILEDRLGFTIEVPDGTSAFAVAASALEFYFLSQDDRINSIARRHARWLMTVAQEP